MDTPTDSSSTMTARGVSLYRKTLDEILPIFRQQYIPMMWRKRIKNALVVMSSESSELYIPAAQRETARNMLINLDVFFGASKKTMSMCARRELYSLFESICFMLDEMSPNQHNSPSRIETTIDLIARVVPADLQYSVVVLDDKKTVVSVNSAACALSIATDLRNEMTALKVEGTIDVVYKSDGQALDSCRTDYSLCSGAPVKRYKRTSDLKFEPSGTVGTFVAMLPSISFQGELFKMDASAVIEDYIEDFVPEEKLGFITAKHVAEESCASVNRLGTCFFDTEGADVCVVQLNEDWLTLNTCQNLVEFPDADSLAWLWAAERPSCSSGGSGTDNSSTYPDHCDGSYLDDGLFGDDNAVVESWKELCDAPFDPHAVYRAGMQVFKMGSVTGWTVGTFLGFYKGSAFNNAHLSVLVEWCPYKKFADNGDCGSVYYCYRDGHNIPLAVHVGSARYNGRNVSIGAPLKDLKLDGYTVQYEVSAHPSFVQFDRTEETEILDGFVSVVGPEPL